LWPANSRVIGMVSTTSTASATTRMCFCMALDYQRPRRRTTARRTKARDNWMPKPRRRRAALSLPSWILQQSFSCKGNAD
jgi:hypothetical protein